MLKRDKLKVIPGRADPAQPDYELDAQVGFLMRVAMQRHTSIFMSASRRVASFRWLFRSVDPDFAGSPGR